jgi:hypothetical protein
MEQEKKMLLSGLTTSTSDTPKLLVGKTNQEIKDVLQLESGVISVDAENESLPLRVPTATRRYLIIFILVAQFGSKLIWSLLLRFYLFPNISSRPHNRLTRSDGQELGKLNFKNSHNKDSLVSSDNNSPRLIPHIVFQQTI